MLKRIAVSIVILILILLIGDVATSSPAELLLRGAGKTAGVSATPTPTPTPAPGPGGITSGLLTWLKYDTGIENTSGVAATDGQTVLNWLDSSSAGNDFTQATTTNKPLYLLNANSTYEGVDFDGTDNFLGAGTTIGNFAKTASVYMYVVVDLDAASSDQTYLSRMLGSGSYIGWDFSQTSSQIRRTLVVNWGSDYIDIVGSGTALANSTLYLLSSVYDGTGNATGVTLKNAGTAITSSSNGNASLTGTMTSAGPTLVMGESAGQYLNGTIFEAAIYSPAPSSADITTIETDVKGRFGL